MWQVITCESPSFAILSSALLPVCMSDAKGNAFFFCYPALAYSKGQRRGYPRREGVGKEPRFVQQWYHETKPLLAGLLSAQYSENKHFRELDSLSLITSIKQHTGNLIYGKPQNIPLYIFFFK